jgi:hypothetical protein
MGSGLLELPLKKKDLPGRVLAQEGIKEYKKVRINMWIF